MCVTHFFPFLVDSLLLLSLMEYVNRFALCASARRRRLSVVAAAARRHSAAELKPWKQSLSFRNICRVDATKDMQIAFFEIEMPVSEFTQYYMYVTPSEHRFCEVAFSILQVFQQKFFLKCKECYFLFFVDSGIYSRFNGLYFGSTLCAET